MTKVICIIGNLELAERMNLENPGVIINDIGFFQHVSAAIREHEFVYIVDSHLNIEMIWNNFLSKLNKIHGNEIELEIESSRIELKT